uniref:Mediator of RNA polymerase II transcription subunit 6 n=2 Tax=Sinocyclocheilus rhinocerous TaxID=307959 RepID=A0A673KLJ4_9TELE
MASVDLRGNNLLGISWVDSGWVPILNPSNVLEYFSERSNPFYDRTCNNEVVKMQRLTLDHLNHAHPPVTQVDELQFKSLPCWLHQRERGRLQLGYNPRTISLTPTSITVHGIQSAFDEAMSFCRYHPSKGYWWHFKEQEERERVKPKSKRKEEPSSLFQRQRVDTLLLDLRNKFPPTFYQSKPGEKPVPVEVKKEPEVPVETVKPPEERETKPAAPQTKPAAPQTTPNKPPPEKRARLQ